MQNELEAEEHAPQRRHRSHHKNQLPTYCPCGKCLGKVKQKPRVLDDHRTRYPREHRSVEDAHLEAPGIRMSPRNIDIPIDSKTPSSSVILSPASQPSSPVGEELDNTPGQDMRDPSPLRLDTPPELQRMARVLNDAQDQANQADEFLVNAMEIDHEHPFDRLLDDLPDQFHHDDLFFDNLDEIDDDEVEDLNNNMYDENFGIPDGEEEREVDQPRFQLREDDEELDLELEQEHNDDLGDDGGGPGALCEAFQEHELIRNAYIDAFVQKVVYGATHRALTHMLKSSRRTIASHPDIGPADIANMAQTIRTVENRLGVSTDNIITTFTLCPACGRLYSPEYIATTNNNTCLNEGCEGLLFNLRTLSSGSRRRVSNLTYPFASPIAWVRHMLSRPGIAELIQNWRDDENGDQGLSAPKSSDEWMQNLDVNNPLGDISTAWGWRSTYAGLERRADPVTGIVDDENILDPPIRFVSLPFGISFSLNTDWFQATKEGNYSVGACYLVMNNLPRHIRFLRENISLCIVIPGPNEPTSYALDQVLEPLVDELLQLKQGVLMRVRLGNPPTYQEELVHGELSQHIADLIARIKIGGGAGVRSELNFCLYCHARLSSLSVAAGYMREGFNFRDPKQELDNAYRWKSLPTHEERKALFERTGNRFTALHRIPGWHTSTSSPPDAMHLLYLGAMNWIVKQILVGPGILNRRHPGDLNPQDVFNDCLSAMWIPKNFQRLPPRLGQTGSSVKADQWKLMSRILYIPLFLALRTGNEISLGYAPRGSRNSPSSKHVTHRAKLLHQQRQKHYQAIGQLDRCPPLEQCVSTRSLRFHYRQVLRFCLAVNIIDKRSITPAEIGFAQRLLESLCIDYANNNVQLPPNFHYLMHLEESMLKTGSVYNTHVWGMERANGIVSRINHNGKSKGVLEGTLMRGWWNHITIQSLINTLQSLPNRTEADESVINDLLMALRGGAEHAQHRGTLAAFIAQCQSAYTRKYGIYEPLRLSSQSRIVDLEELGIYELILRFCMNFWPAAGVYGPGLVQDHYLAPVGMVRNHSYVEYNGIRYGAYEHTSGRGYCYGYVDQRHPVRIERILHIEFPGEPNMRCVCALIRLFQPVHTEPHFPWDMWAGHMGVSSWEHGALGDLVAVHATRFSGVFALFDVPMSYGRYWITIALDSVSPERDEDNEIE